MVGKGVFEFDDASSNVVGGPLEVGDGMLGAEYVTPGRRRAGEVKVVICARLRTVSRGTRTVNSRPWAIRLKRLHVEGLSVGSRDKYDFRKRGALVEIRFGNVDVRMVIGRRWGEIM